MECPIFVRFVLWRFRSKFPTCFLKISRVMTRGWSHLRLSPRTCLAPPLCTWRLTTAAGRWSTCCWRLDPVQDRWTRTRWVIEDHNSRIKEMICFSSDGIPGTTHLGGPSLLIWGWRLDLNRVLLQWTAQSLHSRESETWEKASQMSRLTNGKNYSLVTQEYLFVAQLIV